MEQRRKIRCEFLRNGDGVCKDRISELPKDLLVKIISSLSTKEAIATSVLSKRWRSLWKLVPNLKFESVHHDHDTFSENVYKALILHEAPFIQTLHLDISEKGDCLDMGICIAIAFARHVRKLVLEIDGREEYERPVEFPSVLCSCNNTLEILKLKFEILLDFPSRVCFKSLRKLKLLQVEFKDEESVCNLLGGCPCLQDLDVTRSPTFDVSTFTISVPSLEILTIEDDRPGERGYVINAPRLKYLDIERITNLEFCLIENAPELEQAKVVSASNIINENILASLTSAKLLTLSSAEIKYPTGSIFYQLVSLELGTYDSKWWNLLSFMLDSSPKLQILNLIDLHQKKDCLVSQKWIQPLRVPECLLLHLETFVWTRYEWQREDERDVAMYILKNARRLKKATLTIKPIKSKELKMFEKRCKMLNELASASCDLVFKSK